MSPDAVLPLKPSVTRVTPLAPITMPDVMPCTNHQSRPHRLPAASNAIFDTTSRPLNSHRHCANIDWGQLVSMSVLLARGGGRQPPTPDQIPTQKESAAGHAESSLHVIQGATQREGGGGGLREGPTAGQGAGSEMEAGDGSEPENVPRRSCCWATSRPRRRRTIRRRGVSSTAA